MDYRVGLFMGGFLRGIVRSRHLHFATVDEADAKCQEYRQQYGDFYRPVLVYSDGKIVTIRDRSTD